eukprot:206769_1
MAAIPDQANFDLGAHPIPDNFIDDTLHKAQTEHKRKESQMASVEEDFAKVLDQNVASNIAANLFAYIHDEPPATVAPLDPDEDDARMPDEPDKQQNEYTLDDMLVDTVTAHKHRESRTDFVEAKLHELFPQNDDEDDDPLLGDGQTKGGEGITDMSVIASNLVSFLHDPPAEAPPNEESSNTATSRKKARGSTDLSDLQKEIDRLQSKVNSFETQAKTDQNEMVELNNRIKQLEDMNHNLTKEIQYLQQSKTKLALSTTKSIDELRSILLQYQKHIQLNQ